MKIYSGKLAYNYYKLFQKNLSDLKFYKNFIKQKTSILEIGSGTGRLLLKYLQMGFNVEGIEPNKDMRKICLDNAKKLNLNPKIYNQKLEKLNLNKKYDLIYMPLFVFQHLPKKLAAISLKKCFEHLQNDGEILISIFKTNRKNNINWIINQIFQEEDEIIRLSEKINFDKTTKFQTKYLKFEIFKNNELIDTLFSKIKFQIYDIQEFKNMLELCGFKNIKIYFDYKIKNTKPTDILIFKATKE